MFRAAVAIAVAVLLQGCATGYQQFYSQTAPTKYPETTNTRVFEYPNVDIKELYSVLFSDLLVLGTASYNGPYENPVRNWGLRALGGSRCTHHYVAVSRGPELVNAARDADH